MDWLGAVFLGWLIALALCAVPAGTTGMVFRMLYPRLNVKTLLVACTVWSVGVTLACFYMIEPQGRLLLAFALFAAILTPLLLGMRVWWLKKRRLAHGHALVDVAYLLMVFSLTGLVLLAICSGTS